MKKYLVLLIIMSCLICCDRTPKEETQKNIKIDFEVLGGDDNIPLSRSRIPFRLLDSIPENIKGIVDKDSSFVGYILSLIHI